MRQSIVLLVLILAGIGLYAAYGMITFQPDEAKPFVFAEPRLPEGLKMAPDGSGNLVEDTAPQNTAQAQQTTAAMAKLTQAVSLYQGYEKKVPMQATPTFYVLNTAFVNGALPAYLLSQTKNSSQQRSFEMLTLDPEKSTLITPDKKEINCGSAAGEFDLVIGDSEKNTLSCDVTAGMTTNKDRVFLAGPGDDKITSSDSNVIVNAGTGDDTISLGKGRVIITLGDSWGKDTLTLDCSDAKVEKTEVPQDFPVPWIHPYTNFIVLGLRINPTDVEWQDNVLVNKVTGDTLTVNEKCFNLVSSLGNAATATTPVVPPADPASPPAQ